MIKAFKDRIKAYFLTGLLVVVPIALTIYILIIIVSYMDRFIEFLPPEYSPDAYLPFHIPGLGLLATFLMILLAGLLTRNIAGRKLIALGERIVKKIPLVRNIYLPIKQMFEAIFIEKSDSFKRVVLLEYPRKGTYTIGLVTGVTQGEIQGKNEKKLINVFVPTTPNPTSGFYIVVPEDDLFELKMSVQEAFKLIVSGGVIVPPD
jgi:uncharacterized membrane protein